METTKAPLIAIRHDESAFVYSDCRYPPPCERLVTLSFARRYFNWDVPAWVESVAEQAVQTRNTWRNLRWIDPHSGELSDRATKRCHVSYLAWVRGLQDDVLKDAMFETFNARERVFWEELNRCGGSI